MKVFWLRLLTFCGLWAFMIIGNSENQAISIIIAALALSLYFFISIRRELFPLYLALSVIIFAHGILLIDEAAYTIFLLLFLSIVSAYRQEEKHVKLYLLVNLALSLVQSFIFTDRIIEMIVLCVFFYFLIIVNNRMTLEKKELHEMYEQILGEYRKLKRMNLVANNEARLEERTKIARDIHDSVGHRLTALIMKLEVLAIQHDSPEYRELKQMAQESLDETRQAVKALKNEENEGIATVVHLIRKLEAESNIYVQFTVKHGILSVPLSNAKNVTLYRVIQEALTNVMRHAQSREVQIILGKSAADDVSFEVINKIYGAKPFEFGFGLSTMQERVKEVKGTLHIYQTEERFVVMGTIPYGKGAEQ